MGIRNWCERDSFKYALPKLSLLSSNEIFLECVEILGSVGQNAFSLMKIDEQSLLEKEKEKRDRDYIFSAFCLFATKSDPINFLEKNDIDLGEYTENYIKSLLKGQNGEYINDFIKILNDNNLLANSSFSDD